MPNDFNAQAVESHSAFASETPAEKLAHQVNEKAAHNLFDAAYADLKKGVDKQVADLPLKEKHAFWNEVASHLDESTKTKLGAVFIQENHSLYDRDKNGQLTRSELTQSTQALDPFYKGLGTEAVKSFDVASSLRHTADGIIDKDEAKNFVERQKMSSQDKYTDDVVANIIRKLGEPVKAEPGKEADSPATKAMEYLNSSMSGRAALETSEESQATWKQLSEKLAQNGLVEKLSMAYLKENRENLRMKEDGSFSMEHLALLKKSINPVQKQFAEYVSSNFANIAEVRLNDPLNMISESERKLYERKMNAKPQPVEAKPKQ